MPPPPPPPLAGAKYAPPPSSKASSSGGDGHGLLLESIRQGKKLKKTQINDRSSPLVSVTASMPRSSGEGDVRSGPTGGKKSGGVTAPPGLAGLFAGGMPKLKPVGGGASPKASHSRSHGSIQSLNHSNVSSESQKLMPQEPPPPSQKPTMPPEPPPPSQKPTYLQTADQPSTDRKSSWTHGKPSVAPKPPTLNTKPARPNPPPKLPNLYMPQSMRDDDDDLPTPPSGVNRAQSMRVTKTSSPTNTNSPPFEYRTMGRAAAKNITAVQPPPPPRNSNGGQRPRTALRPPSARPPPPPNKVPPMHPPPPPPPLSLPPPPPPHRLVPPPQIKNNNGLLSPALPQPNLPPVPQNGPPPPPTRNSSIRNINMMMSLNSPSSGNVVEIELGGVDLQGRFRHLFLPLENLPGPEPFAGICKTYPSKIAQPLKRQPAPQPPTHLQLGDKAWLNNTSTC